jgi:dihydroxyacetone kinase-like protein
MSTRLTRDRVLRWLRACADTLAENKRWLTDLDAAIGDADHGINMDRGFQRVVASLDGGAERDLGTILKTVAMTLISSVGGASGPLYGTFFLRASAIAGDRSELAADEVGRLLAAGVQGVAERGRATRGDKTMLDALIPAEEAYREALEEGVDLDAALGRAAAAAEAGVGATIPMVARKGRASYLGERSVGHPDPGATSAWLILRCLAAE